MKARREGKGIHLSEPVDAAVFGSPIVTPDGVIGLVQDEQTGAFCPIICSCRRLRQLRLPLPLPPSRIGNPGLKIETWAPRLTSQTWAARPPAHRDKAAMNGAQLLKVMTILRG